MKAITRTTIEIKENDYDHSQNERLVRICHIVSMYSFKASLASMKQQAQIGNFKTLSTAKTFKAFFSEMMEQYTLLRAEEESKKLVIEVA